MKKLVFVASFAVVLVLANPASAQVTMSPLATWSPNGDGWLVPGEGGYTFLGTGNLEGGLGVGYGHFYLVGRSVGGGKRRSGREEERTGKDKRMYFFFFFCGLKNF